MPGSATPGISVCQTYIGRYVCDLTLAPATVTETRAWKDSVTDEVCVEWSDPSGLVGRAAVAIASITPDDAFKVNGEDGIRVEILGTDRRDVVFLYSSTGQSLNDGTHPIIGYVRARGGNDDIYGSDSASARYRDELNGNLGRDKIFGGDGKDTIDGEEGNDILDGGLMADTIDGGDGNDEIYGGNGPDYIINSNDVSSFNQIWGGSGDDTIYGGFGIDHIWGGPGDDTIEGNDGDDVLFGEAGNDVISAIYGDNKIAGGDGEDILSAGNGDDVLCGESDFSRLDNNELEGGFGTDCLDAGQGNTAAGSTLSRVQDCGPGGSDWEVRRGSPGLGCEYYSAPSAPDQTESWCVDPETSWIP